MTFEKYQGQSNDVDNREKDEADQIEDLFVERWKVLLQNFVSNRHYHFYILYVITKTCKL